MENIYSRGAVENMKAIYFSTKIAFNVGRELFPFSFPLLFRPWMAKQEKQKEHENGYSDGSIFTRPSTSGPMGKICGGESRNCNSFVTFCATFILVPVFNLIKNYCGIKRIL